MSQDDAYELELDATEATLCGIEEQLEDDSPVMQAQGAHKVYHVFTAQAVTYMVLTSPECQLCAVPAIVKEPLPLCSIRGIAPLAYRGGPPRGSLKA